MNPLEVSDLSEPFHVRKKDTEVWRILVGRRLTELSKQINKLFVL